MKSVRNLRAKRAAVDRINPATEQRLIEAAGEVFARLGFRAATIRDICKQAKANISAVNYHFGDKEQLYHQVLKYSGMCANEQYPIELGRGDEPPEHRLRAYVHSLLRRMLDKGRPAWHGKLMIREMTDPTPALDSIVQDAVRPQTLMLAGLAKAISGIDHSEQTLRLMVASIVGQCTYYRHAHAVVTRLHPEQQFEPKDIEKLADHITTFSVAAIKHYPASASISL